MDSYYNNFDSDDLWVRINDKSTYLFIRTPMMFELARRNDIRIMDFCEELLKSGDVEEWFVALRVFSSMGNDSACQRLIDLYIASPPHRRGYIAIHTAMTTGPCFEKDFNRIAVSMAAAGTLDVSGWTDTALSCLKSSCKRIGIEMIELKGDESMSTFSNEIYDESPVLFASQKQTT